MPHSIERWSTLTLSEQLANIGSEVSRAFTFIAKGDAASRDNAVTRALELINLSIMLEKKSPHIRELTRLKEVICDSVMGGNEYESSRDALENYFLPFAIRARL